MIRPGTLNLAIPAGSAVSFRLTLVAKSTGEALPLGAYAPFTAAVAPAPGREPVTLAFTVDNSGAAAGVLTISASAAATADARGSQPWDLIDKNGLRWIAGKVDFSKTVTPAPPP